MEIRLLNAGDLSQYKAIMLEAFDTFPDAFTSTRNERASMPDEWWLGRLDGGPGSSLAYGAFDNKTLIGTVALDFNKKAKTKHKTKLIAMFVRPSAQRRGTGKKLLEFAIAQARARKEITVITLTVTTGNQAAITLYHSVGFERFGLEPMAIATADGYLGKEHMFFRLQPVVVLQDLKTHL